MFNNLNILFLTLTIFSSIISISSSNWLGAWMGLELNMISFIPLMINNKNIFSNESALKYFLIQASASSMFIMSCVMSCFSYSLLSNALINATNSSLLFIPLLIKMGSAPFQSWFVSITEGMTWFNCYMLMGWQKIAPLFILSYTFVNNKTIFLFSITSMIVGSIGGLNQTSIRKLMAYSSVNHLGWLLSASVLSKLNMVSYFIFYLFMTLFVLNNLNMNYTFQFNQNFSKMQTVSFLISLLSLGGLPPFIGFLPKWSVIQLLIFNDYYLITAIAILTALITLLFYLRLTYSSTIMASSIPKWMDQNSPSPLKWTSTSFLSLFSGLGLILFNLILT